MRLFFSKHFLRAYSKAPEQIQQAFDKQAILLCQSLRHPSLRAKKFDESKDRWQARVTGSWRFYFNIEGNTYVLKDITPHPK